MKRSPKNIAPFVLEGLPLLHKLDQRMMRNLRKLADRTDSTVEDLIHKAIVQTVTKREAERELKNKIIPFSEAQGNRNRRIPQPLPPENC